MSSISPVSSVASQPPVTPVRPVDNDRAQAAKAADDRAEERRAARKEDGKGQIVDVQA